jgi:ribosomal protein S18 acetylase RimI-like enzyme
VKYLRITDDFSSVESFLRTNPGLHLYSLGDLDESLKPMTEYLAAEDEGAVVAVVVVFEGYGEPVVLALGSAENTALPELISHIKDELPNSGQVHYTASAREALREEFVLDPDTPLPNHVKMLKTKPRESKRYSHSPERLSTEDQSQVERLYKRAFPKGESAFDPTMLGWPFFGVRLGNSIVAAAGVHFISESLGVAAIGNVATDPDFRGQGMATAVTGALCEELDHSVDWIGLNVKTDNKPAIAVYRNLGFETTDLYWEARFRRK